jgi:mono/diheme cytochrome c family protein
MCKRNVYNIIILLMGMIALFSCEYEKIVPDLPDPSVPVSYSADIQHIWNKNCVGCHGAGATPPDLTPANSYNALVSPGSGWISLDAPETSVIYTCMITGGSMAAYSNAKDAGLVLNWIKQGAKND